MLGIVKKMHWIKKEKFKRAGILILVNLIILFTLLVIFEIFLHLFSWPIYGFQKGVFMYDDSLGYKLSSNYEGMQSIYGRQYFVSTNQKGLRDSRDYDYKKPQEIKRIVVIGDSISFGNGVDLEDSYIEHLRNSFAEENVEIINLGVPGYGINNEYVSFILEGQKYEPDLLMIQYGVNDWGTYQLDEENRIKVDFNHSFVADENGFLIDYEKQSIVRSIHLFLLRNLRSYSFIYTKSRNFLTTAINFVRGKPVGVPGYILQEENPEYQKNYQGYYNLLKDLKDKTDAKIAIFAGPLPQDLLEADKIKEEYKLDYTPDFRQTQKNLKRASEELGIDFIDMEYDKKDIFLEVDNHWNEKGNKLVAETIYEPLKNILFD